MNTAMDSTSRRPVVAASQHAASADQVRRVLLREGHFVVASTQDVERLATADRARGAVVVVAADRKNLGRTIQLLQDVLVLDPNAQLLVLHDIDDVHSASTALYQGARSCPRADGVVADNGVAFSSSEAAEQLVHKVAEVLAAPSVIDRSTAVVTARHALELAAEGRTVEALGELCRIDGSVAALAVADQLTDTCAGLFGRVAERTRFPIPLDYVVDRLLVPTEADVGLCYPLLERAAFRSVGFDLDIQELATAHGHRGVLFGAFHSTRAVLQFLAERWWRTPRSILEEFDRLALSDGGPR